jgi:uncharacterized protein (UPF0332 family)
MEQAQTALDDAKFLLDNGRSSQSILNRAYYSMFYATLALLQEAGMVPSKHSGVISLFDTEFVRKGIFQKELSKYLHKAFELRQASDYKSFHEVSKEKAEENLNNAVVFVETVKEYFSRTIETEEKG